MKIVHLLPHFENGGNGAVYAVTACGPVSVG